MIFLENILLSSQPRFRSSRHVWTCAHPLSEKRNLSSMELLQMKERADKFEKTDLYLSDDRQALIAESLRQM